MQIREYIHHFITLCSVFVTLALLPATLSGQEKADTLLSQPLAVLPPDTLIIQQDTIPTDTLQQDSIKQEKPLFNDIISYSADDSVRFSIDLKKVFLYGNATVKYKPLLPVCLTLPEH